MARRATGLGSLFAGMGFLLVSGICASAAAVLLQAGILFSVMLPLFTGLPFDDLRLDRGAVVPVSGEVVGVVLVPSAMVDGNAVYSLSYRFEVGGVPVEDEIRVVEGEALVLAAPGDPFELEYLADNPTICRPQGGKAHPEAWLGMVGFPILALGLLACVPVVVGFLAGILLIGRAMRTGRRAGAGAAAHS